MQVLAIGGDGREYPSSDTERRHRQVRLLARLGQGERQLSNLRDLHGHEASKTYSVSLRIQSMSIDARDPSSLATFWQAVLGWRRTYEERDEVVLEPPSGSAEDGVVPDLLFLKVDEGSIREARVEAVA